MKRGFVHSASIKLLFRVSLFMVYALVAGQSPVQVNIDTLTIRIGEEITYTIEVATELNIPVIFPEGQTFSPLEVIASYAIDTSAISAQSAKIKLIKKYGLTQFDSGQYTIPKQRIQIGTQTVATDSFSVTVNNVVVDTLKQGLYDIKPIMEVPGMHSKFWKYLLWIGLLLVLIGAFLFWLLRRHKKQIEADRIIPPFEQALASLHTLDESDLIYRKDFKSYYTVLTDTVRRYYDERVYDHAMESTTDELIERLQLEKESGHINFSPQTITALRDIFKRADLVKFARINPPEGKAQADRIAVEQIVKETREALPEPTEEELLQDQAYQILVNQKRTRKLWISGIAGVVGIVMGVAVVAVLVNGYDNVRDFVFGNVTRELAEGDWITSEYGYPGIVVSAPEVLVRQEISLPPEMQSQVTATSFGWETEPSNVRIAIIQLQLPQGADVPLEQIINAQLTQLETQGFKAAIVKNEEYTTVNGAQGIKTFGPGRFNIDAEGENVINGEYALLSFQAENIVQQLLVTWNENDPYSVQIAERVINSVELQNAAE